MDWRSGNLGKMSCLKMTLAEPDALNVKIDCDGAAWQSSDGGSTWTALVSDAGAVMKASH
jgi:hypothetical protein